MIAKLLKGFALVFRRKRSIYFTTEDRPAMKAGKIPNIPVKSITPVGSRVTCNPAPTNTDADYLVFIDECAVNEFLCASVGMGYEFGGSFHGKEHKTAKALFYSLKLGEVNLIVTDKEWFHRRFLAASNLAKHLNLMEKSDRIRLFQAVLYGNTEPE